MDLEKFYKGKKILITGHTGFKGAWLAQVLLKWGAEVSGVSLLPETEPNLFDILKIKERASNHFCDIRNFDEVKEIMASEKPEIVFHLAAQAIVRDSYDDPLKTFSTNSLGMANVLQAIKETDGVRSVVIITTDKVYENREWVYPYRENDALGGYDPYSASKAAADIIANSYIRSFFNPSDFEVKHGTLVAITRAGNVIGGGDWANHRLIPDIIRAVYEKKIPVEIRNPQAIRPWEHVLEPLSGYLLLGKELFEGKKDFSGAWNFGPNDESFVPVEKLIQEGIKILGKGEFEIQPDTSGKHEANLLKLDISKAKSVLGWRPKFNFEQNLRFTFDWYRKFYSKSESIREFTDSQIEEFFS